MPISTATVSPTSAPAWAGIQTKYNARVRDIAWDALGFTLDSTNKEPLGLVPIQIQPATNNATRPALTLNQDNNSVSLSIDSEQTTTSIVDISGAALTTGTAVNIGDLNALTSGVGVNIASASTDTGAFTLLQVQNTSLTATGATAFKVIQASTGPNALFQNTHAGATGPVVDLQHNSASPAVDDVIGRIRFIGNNDNGSVKANTWIQSLVSTVASGDYSTRFIFYTEQNDLQNEAMRILSTGQIQVDVASAIAGTTGTADVFDEHDDVGLLSRWNLDPESRRVFMESLEAIGKQMGTPIVERKHTGSGWLMNLQSMQFLVVGAINQLNRKLEQVAEHFGARLQLLERHVLSSSPVLEIESPASNAS